MNTASTAAQNARDAATEAREGLRDFRKTASESSGEFERDLQTLREDFRRLAEQVGELVTATGNVAWRRAKSHVDDAMAGAQDKGREAAGAVREVSDHFVAALDESIKTRPYATLAVVAGLAFLFGAALRR